MNIDYSKITDNPRVIELLKQRTEIENKIKAIDETALIMHELELLSLPDVVESFYCLKKQGVIEEHEKCDKQCSYCKMEKSLQ